MAVVAEVEEDGSHSCPARAGWDALAVLGQPAAGARHPLVPRPRPRGGTAVRGSAPHPPTRAGTPPVTLDMWVVGDAGGAAGYCSW